MFIYKIENTVTKKVYIGKTISANIELRWKDHRNKLRRGTHVNHYIQRAYNKYGVGSFVYSILSEHNNLDELNDAETIAIIHHRSCNPTYGYNMSFGGEGDLRTDVVKKKLSKIASLRIGKKNPFFGKKHTEETKNKLRDISKIRATPEHIQKMIDSRSIGYAKKSIETRKKMSLASKGKPKSQTARENMKLAWAKRRQERIND